MNSAGVNLREDDWRRSPACVRGDDDDDLDVDGRCESIPGFRLVRPLGSGGSGVVWEAEQISLGRRVALKVLRHDLHLGDETVRRFRHEAMMCARLSHPGIIKVFDIGEVGETHFISQELVAGGATLADWLREQRTAGGSEWERCSRSATLVAAVADALQAVHDVGVIHRDVKPSNILMSADRAPKVSDFGLAVRSEEPLRNEINGVVGTPHYMSPEQVAGGHIGIDHRTDIFSLGATLYELLTLQRPFLGEGARQVMEAVLLDESPDPKRACPRVPDGLAAICTMALSKRRADRYQSMGALRDDLRRYANGESVTAMRRGSRIQSVGLTSLADVCRSLVHKLPIGATRRGER